MQQHCISLATMVATSRFQRSQLPLYCLFSYARHYPNEPLPACLALPCIAWVWPEHS